MAVGIVAVADNRSAILLAPDLSAGRVRGVQAPVAAGGSHLAQIPELPDDEILRVPDAGAPGASQRPAPPDRNLHQRPDGPVQRHDRGAPFVFIGPQSSGKTLPGGFRNQFPRSVGLFEVRLGRLIHPQGTDQIRRRVPGGQRRGFGFDLIINLQHIGNLVILVDGDRLQRRPPVGQPDRIPGIDGAVRVRVGPVHGIVDHDIVVVFVVLPRLELNALAALIGVGRQGGAGRHGRGHDNLIGAPQLVADQLPVNRHRPEAVGSLVEEDPLPEEGSSRRQLGVFIEGVVNIVSLIGGNGDILLGFIEARRQIHLRRRRQKIVPLRDKAGVTGFFIGGFHQFPGFGQIPRMPPGQQNPDMVDVGFRPGGGFRIDLLIERRRLIRPAVRLQGASQHQEPVHVDRALRGVLGPGPLEHLDGAPDIPIVHQILADGPEGRRIRFPPQPDHQLLAHFRPVQNKPAGAAHQRQHQHRKEGDLHPVDHRPPALPVFFISGRLDGGLFKGDGLIVVEVPSFPLDASVPVRVLLGFGGAVGLHLLRILLRGLRGRGGSRAAAGAALSGFLADRRRRAAKRGLPRPLSLADGLGALRRNQAVPPQDFSAFRADNFLTFRIVTAFGTKHSLFSTPRSSFPGQSRLSFRPAPAGRHIPDPRRIPAPDNPRPEPRWRSGSR